MILKISEEFKKYLKDVWSNPVEMYVNPTPNELNELVKDQRTYGDYIKIVVLPEKKLMYAPVFGWFSFKIYN